MRTYRVLVVAFVSLLITATAFGAVGVGVKAGMSWATQEWIWPTTEFDTELDSRNGIRAGAYLEFELAEWFSIVPEMDYVQMGAKYVEGESYDWRVDYVMIPVLAKARVPLGRLSPYAYAGPRLDILIGTFADGYPENLDDVDFGADIGAGIELGRFLLEFRYSLAFNDSWSKGPIEITNQAYGLVLGFAIR